MDEQLKFGIPEEDAQRIFLALCDAAERLEYHGVSGLFDSVNRLAEFVCPEGSCGVYCHAYERFVKGMCPAMEMNNAPH